MQLIYYMKSTTNSRRINSDTMIWREELLEWLSEVSNKMNLSLDVYASAVEIFDEVIHSSQKEIQQWQVDYLHLSVVSSLILAFKLDTRLILSFDTVLKVILKDKFKKDQLVKSEISILKKLKFKMPKIDSFSDFAKTFIEEFYNSTLKLDTQSRFPNKEKLLQVAQCVYKIILSDYKTLHKYKSSRHFYMAIIFTTFSLFQHLLDQNNREKLFRHFSSLIEKANLNNEVICKMSRKFADIISKTLDENSSSKFLKRDFEKNYNL